MSMLTGKTAIVTGASRGIGLAIARRFVAEGARVVIASRSAPPDDMQSGACRWHGADIADPEQVEARRLEVGHHYRGRAVRSQNLTHRAPHR